MLSQLGNRKLELDWNKATNISSGFTAPVNGIVYLSLHSGTGNNDWAYINGFPVFFLHNFSGVANVCEVTNATIIVNKGDKITWTSDVLNPLFVPYK